MTDASDERVWFDARITPNRAMSQRGLILVGACLVGPALIFSVGLIAIGAWPASIFLGAEALMAVVALFACAHRLAAREERVVLTDNALVVEALDRGKTTSAERVEPTWARVERQMDADAGCEAVFVRFRSRRVRIAEALSPAERLDFANALETALHHRKSRFAAREA